MTPSSFFFYEYWFRKRAQKGSPDIHFTNNARMVYDHPVLIRSSDSGLNAFFPALFILKVSFGFQIFSIRPKNNYHSA